jgi:hypothetical protein
MTVNATDIATTGKDGIAAVEVRQPGVVTAEDLMPVLDLATAVRRRNFMTQVAQQLMLAGIDYGVIPGTGSKPTLLKPGAERLCTLFGLSPELDEMAAIEDWDGTGEGHGEALFYYRYRVRLTRNGILLAEGIGSCSSRETKFRYRSAERSCPKCGRPAIIRGREEYGRGWLCFLKKGGCGAKYKDGDAAIESQPAGRVLNPDVADQVNTIQKMAHKRALVAAVLIATGASEFYSQDAEDMAVIDVPPAQPAVVNRASAAQAKPASSQEAKPQSKPESLAKPWQTFRGMIEAFAALHGRLTPQHDHVYSEVLAEFGVEHSNQFRQAGAERAIDAYHRLLERVRECEAEDEASMIDTAAMRDDIRQPAEEATT